LKNVLIADIIIQNSQTITDFTESCI